MTQDGLEWMAIDYANDMEWTASFMLRCQVWKLEERASAGKWNFQNYDLQDLHEIKPHFWVIPLYSISIASIPASDSNYPLTQGIHRT